MQLALKVVFMMTQGLFGDADPETGQARAPAEFEVVVIHEVFFPEKAYGFEHLFFDKHRNAAREIHPPRDNRPLRQAITVAKTVTQIMDAIADRINPVGAV